MTPRSHNLSRKLNQSGGFRGTWRLGVQIPPSPVYMDITYVAWKAVKGRRYAYLVRSIRLPDGKVAKIEKRLLTGDENKKNNILVKKYSDYFGKKEAEIAAK